MNYASNLKWNAESATLNRILIGKTFLLLIIKLFNSSTYSISTPPFNLSPLKSLIKFKDFPHILNGKLGRAYLDSSL